MQVNRQKYSLEILIQCSKYLEKDHTLWETADFFNLNYKTMINGLIRYKLYSPKRHHKISKNSCIFPNFFEVIDTHEKAYFLGYLMSDGYICSTTYNKQIGIGLQTQDEYILDYYRNIISPKLRVRRYKNSSKLVFTSTKMYNDLIKLNFTENKSTKDYHFPSIPEEFYCSFICGYFDGDGCITIKSTGYSVCSICGNSKVFLADLKNILSSNNIQTREISTENRNRNNPLFVLYLSKREGQLNFKNFIYSKTPIYLKRKYDKFMKIPC